MEVLVEYEYVAVEEDELTIRPGDVITDVVKISDGWMEGELDGKTGAFPDNFVKEIKREEKVKGKDAPAPPVASHKKQGSHVEELAKRIGTQGIKMGPPPSTARVVKRDQARRLYRAKVTFSYTPENEDELRLEVGDVIDVLHKAEEGWLEGALNGKTGMFPSNFVEVCEEEASTEEKPAEAGGKKKEVRGQGFGNIFTNGPITLRPTGSHAKAPLERPEVERKASPPPPKEAEKTASLKRPPPALPPKDITEGKKSSSAEAISPISDLPPRSEIPSQGSSFSEPHLESIPEIIISAYDCGTSCTLDSSGYSYDEQTCPHGEDADHTSLDSEGCAFLSPRSIESPSENVKECSPPFPVSPYEADVLSPLMEMTKTKLNAANSLDGRRSGASGISSGSDVPLDNSAISKTRATPPPKLTFKKKRAMGTPKNHFSAEMSPSTPLSEPCKPPPVHPRKFHSASGIGWTETKESEGRKRTPVRLSEDSAEASKEKKSDVYFSVDGSVSSTANASTLWGFNKDGEFTLGPQMVSEKVPKKVTFPGAESPRSDSINITDEDGMMNEEEVIDHIIEMLNQPQQPFTPIDPLKITDSIDLAKEKLRSGKWSKPDDDSEGTFDHDNNELEKDIVLKRKRRSVGQRVRDSLSSALSSLLSSSPRRASKLSKLPSTLDNLAEIPSASDEKAITLPEMSTSEDGPTDIPVDIVSATAHPASVILSEKIQVDPIVFRERFSTLPKKGKVRRESSLTPKARVKRKKSILKSPFSRWSRYKLQKKVSPMEINENRPETPVFQDELIDGMTYKRMPDIEPTYFESLNELGRLSPSVRRLSQRYSLFQKGTMATRSTEYLERDSLGSVENETSSSMPKLPVVHSDKDVPRMPYSLFLSHVDNNEEKDLGETSKAGMSSSDGNDINKTKPKRRFSLRRSIGTWPRKFSTKYWSGDSSKKEQPVKESAETQKENCSTQKKRWSLGRSKSQRTTGENKNETVKRTQSFFGSLRKRFSLRRAPVQPLVSTSSTKVSFVEPKEEEHHGRTVEYKDGLKRKSIMRLTVSSPPPAENFELLIDEQNPVEGTTEKDLLPQENSKSLLEKMSDSKRILRSTDLWRIESSPDCGEKWIARNVPTKMASLPRKIMVKKDSSLTECKSDGHLPNPLEIVDLRSGAECRGQSGEVIEEPIVQTNLPMNKSINMSGVDTFFSSIDKGVCEEVEVTSRDRCDASCQADELEESLVIDSLNEIVDQETNGDLAKAIVAEVIHRAIAEIAEEIGEKTSYLDKLILNQCKRNRSKYEEAYFEQLEFDKKMDKASASYDVTKAPYYCMMTEEFEGLNAESQTPNTNINNNENNSNANLSQEVHQFFDLSYEEENDKESHSPQYLGPSVRYEIEGFNTPSRKEYDNCELMDLVDAFFGKVPSPLSPVDKLDIQHKLDTFIKFQEKRPLSSSSADSPVIKKSRLSIEEEANTDEINTSKLEERQSPKLANWPSNLEERESPDFINWQTWYSAFKQSDPAVLVQPEYILSLDEARDSSSIVSSSSYSEVEQEVLGIKSRGIHDSGDWREKDSFSAEPKPAGSMFYGDLPPSEGSCPLSDQQPHPVRQNPDEKMAGSFFRVESKHEEEKPRITRRVSLALDERPVGIHLGIHQPIMESAKIPGSRLLDERPVGFHGQVADFSSRFSPRLWSSPKPEDRPVGVHYGSRIRDAPMEDRDGLEYRLLQSPRIEDRPLGIHFGQVTVPEEEFLTPATNLDDSFCDSRTPSLEEPPRLKMADVSVGALSYYSLDGSINFSSSSIVDQLP